MEKSSEYLLWCGSWLLFMSIGLYVRARKGKPRLMPGDLFLNGFLFWGYFALITWISGRTVLEIPSYHTSYVLPDVFLMIGVFVVFASMSAIYYWFPRWTGRDLHSPFGFVHFWVSFFGVSVLFFPLYRVNEILRSISYLAYGQGDAAASFLVRFFVYIVLAVLAVQVLFVINLVYSAIKGPKSVI